MDTLKSLRSGKAHDNQYAAERGQCEVFFSAAPVRFSHGMRGHSFVLLMDHSGYVSICGKTELIKSMETASDDVVDLTTGKHGTPTVTVRYMIHLYSMLPKYFRKSSDPLLFNAFRRNLGQTIGKCAV